MRFRLVACLLAVACLTTGVRAADPTSQTLLTLASRYLTTFIDRFSNVVAEEQYVQDWRTNTGVALLHRETRAQFLLTRVFDSNSWQAFRDVFEANGTPVRDREDRLSKLFLEPAASVERTLDQARAIAAEGARYNIGNLQRTINHPLFVLIFLQAANQTHFSYTVGRNDTTVGPSIWIVEFKEVSRPTLVRGTTDKDVPAKGRFWIDATNGRIVRTELKLEDNVQSTEITAYFQNDNRFRINVPTNMEEQYDIKGGKGRVVAKATYSDFREFQVSTRETVKPDGTVR